VLSEPVSEIDITSENIGATSLINHGLVFFAGGLARFIDGPETNVKNVDIYNLNSNSWSTAHLSQGRYEVVATSLHSKGLAFFAGGAYLPNGDKTKDSLLSNIVDIYNANTNTWSVSALSQNRSGIAATSLDKQNLVFFAGGYITINLGYPQFTTDTIDIYNATSNTWSVSKLFIKNMFVFATALSNYGLAFMGGSFQKKLKIYNANTNTWTDADLTYETNYGAATSLESYGLAFFAGGATQNNVITDNIDVYDAKTDAWSKLTLSSQRAGLSASSLDKYGLVFFAGGGDLTSQKNTVDILDVKSMSWSISYLKSSRAIIASAYLTDLAFFGGGYSAIDLVNSIDIFSLCTNSFTTIKPITCNTCPSGSFCNHQITPIRCPFGSYCGVNVSKPSKCPGGTYNDVLGKSIIDECKKCPIGTYNSLLGQGSLVNCLECQLGTYCQEGSIVSQACPENYYCPDPKTKNPCPAGTYLDGTFAITASKCKSCIQGHFCDGKGNSPVPCAPGTFSSKNGLSSCTTCPEGSSCPFGCIEPTICDINFISKKGSSACTACPSGTYSSIQGATDCISCSGNQFDVSGWWCMSSFERILFVSVWAGTILSAYATLKKIFEFVRNRLKIIRQAELKFTWRRFIFIKEVENKLKSIEIEMPPVKTEITTPPPIYTPPRHHETFNQPFEQRNLQYITENQIIYDVDCSIENYLHENAQVNEPEEEIKEEEIKEEEIKIEIKSPPKINSTKNFSRSRVQLRNYDRRPNDIRIDTFYIPPIPRKSQLKKNLDIA